MSKKIENAISITPVTAFHVTKEVKEAAKAKLHDLIQEETRLVRGVFICYETPGLTQVISVRKYPGIPPFSMPMTDGCTYEVPLYVARFLNGIDISAGAATEGGRKNAEIGTCSYGVHGFKWDKNSAMPAQGQESFVPQVGSSVVPVHAITKRVRRYGFNSTEFGAIS